METRRPPQAKEYTLGSQWDGLPFEAQEVIVGFIQGLAKPTEKRVIPSPERAQALTNYLNSMDESITRDVTTLRRVLKAEIKSYEVMETGLSDENLEKSLVQDLEGLIGKLLPLD